MTDRFLAGAIDRGVNAHIVMYSLLGRYKYKDSIYVEVSS